MQINSKLLNMLNGRKFEPRHEKQNSVVSEQVRHKPSCTSSSSAASLVSHTQFSHDAAHLCIQNIILLTKRQSTALIYQWSLNDLNGDLGICILITKMLVFLEIDQKLPNTCSLGLPYVFFVPVSIYFRLFPTWAFGSVWTCFLIHVTVFV